MTPRDDASERQVRAADPEGSVWLSANAGSGKTRVLTDRVARLLLQGVSPQNILCLTYTKAAASEMQNRLFKRLGAWAMQEESELRKALVELGLEGDVSDDTLAAARRLFARAIETPGGLKIQTIHSFCASLLRRFPLEAGVSPQFHEMDERAAKLLRESIIERIADSGKGDVIDRLASHLSGDDLATLSEEIVKHKEAFQRFTDRSKIWSAFGVSGDATTDDIIRIAFDGSEPDLLKRLGPICAAQSKLYADFGARLAALDFEAPTYETIKALYKDFLYQSGDKAGTSKSTNFPQSNHKKAVEAFAPVLPELHAFMDRVAEAYAYENSLYAARKSIALYDFADVFLPEYELEKQKRGWLDFDDLILRARQLLTAPAVAQWVLFRLDGGVDHILVDEAQDTSPVQWDVIKRLAQEFTTGVGARANVPRTIFVVGDKKQSIYSFQGADPEGFDRMREHFGERMEEAELPFTPMQLLHSFRSADAILKLVDITFAERVENGLGGQTDHIAFKTAMPGRADLWPAVPKAENEDEGKWYDPVDRRGEQHHTTILANRVADEIKAMIGKADIPEEIEKTGKFRMRKVRAGDILILVQRRSALFHDIIRACKSRLIPIAGADRLRIGAELAVRDITALLSFLATPEDDLSLACALRSPLFGWSQAELHALAQPRKKGVFLWRALRDAKERYPDTMSVINDLRDYADFLRPYDLIERILTRHDGRRLLLSRLGAEAEDGIDALLSQALSYEQSDVPSLTGFLTWLASEEVTIKRQLDSADDRIRVMTVHGAKGLESPIVILPDTGKPDNRLRDEIYVTEHGPLWKTPVEGSPQILKNARASLIEKLEEERDRLLYVAMTRAEKWLIVAGCGDLGKDGESWYNIVEAGMQEAGASAQAFSFGPGQRLETGDWGLVATDVSEDTASPLPTIPQWATLKASPPPAVPQTLAPSGLGGAKALGGEAGLDEETALMRGRGLHRLLEHLPLWPTEQWSELAEHLLTTEEDVFPDHEIALLLEEASAVLRMERFEEIFGPESLAEVDLSASLPQLEGRRIHGAIDRLIVKPDRVLAVDFKTNEIVPAHPAEVPVGILRQLGAYHDALCQIYPDRKIEAAVLWTKNATLMPLPHDLMISALNGFAAP